MDDHAVALLTILFGACCLLWLRPTRRMLDRSFPAQAQMLARFDFGLLVVTGVLLVGLGSIGMPYIIPSGSMIPTLAVGDVILVDRTAYGIRLPWGQRLTRGNAPARGDVVVFRFPGYQCRIGDKKVRSGDETCMQLDKPVPSENWVKRVIGVPGDRVVMRGDALVINGTPVATTNLGAYRGDPSQPDDRTLLAHGAEVLEEHLPGRPHRIATMVGYHIADPVPGVTVPAILPPNCYFVLGDDRHNSIDSRWWGCVTRDAIVGRAVRVIFSWASVPSRESRVWLPIR
ncbi:signal peptidase I [Rhodanobacter sp. FW106-PBR-LB-2-11]|uniref:signal peptidase I n=1 Tax=Rhodanobacter sp. FW106-PBR-LB-2-11 TaxID=1524463 RepID=UPI0034E565FC